MINGFDWPPSCRFLFIALCIVPCEGFIFYGIIAPLMFTGGGAAFWLVLFIFAIILVALIFFSALTMSVDPVKRGIRSSNVLRLYRCWGHRPWNTLGGLPKRGGLGWMGL